jgi:glycosyltransferase involved in cell wall biosynthesis
MSSPVDPKTVFVVIPAFNEEEMIGKVLQELQPFEYQLVVVDDGSAIVLNEYVKGSLCYLLRHQVNLGQGAALQTGIGFALEKGASFIVTFDADGQHTASDIATLLTPLATGTADVALGSRFIRSDGQVPAKRKKLLKMARYVNFFFTGLLLSDAHNGLRAFSREAAARIHITQNGMAHATELIAEIRKKKLRYVELPVTIHYTEYSRKKGQTLWSGFRIFFDILLNKIFK